MYAFRGLLLLLFVTNLHVVEAGNGSSSASLKEKPSKDVGWKRLITHLFENYVKAERPVVAKSTIVTVRMDPVLINILDIDEVSEAMTANFWMRMYWVDQFLHWDPHEYDGTNELDVPQNMVWKPDIMLYNNLGIVDHVESEILSVKVNSTGHVQFLFPAIYQVSCSIDIQYFPFDTQNCSLKFGSWSFHGLALDVQNVRDVPPMENFKKNPEWDLKAAAVIRNVILYSCCPEPYPDITVSFLVARKSLFYVVTLIFPALTITFVSLIGLFSPSNAFGEREEKVTLGMTSLLTMTVLLIRVSDQLPRTAKTLPIFSVFYMYQMFLCVMGTICTVVIVNLEKQGQYGQEPPKWAKHLFIDILPFWLLIKQPCKKRIHNKPQTIRACHEKDFTPTTRTHFFEVAILRKLTEIQNRILKSEKQKEIVDAWDRICHCMERACMWFFIIVFVFGNTFILCIL